MKTPPLYLILATLLSFAAPRVEAGVVTLTAKKTGGIYGTNEMTIGPYEVAELLSFPWQESAEDGQPTYLHIIKDGTTVTLFSQDRDHPDWPYPRKAVVIAGPATFRLVSRSSAGGLCTFKIAPESFPPDRTILIPPGTNQVFLTLQCSTNLVEWSSATNGVYGPLPQAKFFRIKLDPLP